jgi:uncharacterized protein YfbU (UPF0304 family)
MNQNKTERFEMRLDQAKINQVDAWRSEQGDMPSRSEAVRRLIEAGLDVQNSPVRIGDGQKLILAMLCDLYHHHKVKDGEIDPDFVTESIWGGHCWALDWKYQGLFRGHEDKPRTVSEVCDILDMWDLLESSFEKLKAKEKDRFAKEKESFPVVKFPGFDGNYEAEHLGVLLFLTQKMDRFERFKKREANSHCPVLGCYRRMYAVFEPMQARLTLTGSKMNISQIMDVLSAWRPED